MRLSKISNIVKESALSVKSGVPLRRYCSDIFETSGRWSKPSQEYVPKCAEGSAIPSHHYISGCNSAIRHCFNDMKLIKGRLRFLRYFGVQLNKEKVQRIMKLVNKIDSEFLLLPPLEKDCVVYRGRGKSKWSDSLLSADFKVVSKAKVGDVIVPDTAYSYCAFDRSFAEIWCQKNQKRNESIMYEIRIPRGAKVSRSMEHDGEIIMPRGAEYRVVAKKKRKNHTNIILEYLLPKNSNI